ncbi:nitrate reductase [Vibrio sp.]|nr:nitrate reductase [Vibrio sp.]
MTEGWIKSTCAYCGVGCGIEARPLANGLLEVRGDKEHPSNYGKLCTKGIALGDTVIHDGRLVTPKIKNHKGVREICDWESALDHVAQGFKNTIEKFGSDSVAFYVSGQLLTEDYYVANKLIKGFMGTANIDSNSRLCMASSVVGHKRAFGMDSVPVCYEDMEKSDLVILVGSNLAWCHPVLFQRLRAAKQSNPALEVIVIDPRRNESCEIADLHLAINPGSDVALFNGLLTYLGEFGYLDNDFISDATISFNEAYQAALQESDIEDKTGLTHEQVTALYSKFAQTKKVVTIYSQGVNQSTQGSDKVNSIINCHLATGKIGREGAGPFSVTGQPNAMGGREVGALANTLAAHMEFGNIKDIEAIQTFWNTDNLAQGAGLKAIDMFDAIHSGKIKAVWIMATNPVVSLPNSDKIREALERCPLVVVSDCIENTATTQYADVLLPAQGWSEKSGTVTNSERRISRQRRLLASPGLARPDWWIISQVAQKMGYQEQFSYRHEGDVFKEYAKLTTLNNESHQRDLNLAGLVNLTDMEYHQLKPQQWPVLQKQNGIINQRLFCDQKFFTQSRKANFVAVTHRPPQASTSKRYPLVLNSGRIRDHWHTMTRTGLSARLAEHNPEPTVTINAKTATNYELVDGKLATIYNQLGECVVRVKVEDSVRDDELFVPIHWNELTAPLSKPCQLIDAREDSLSGQPEFKYTPVSIKPLNYQTTATLLCKTTIKLPSIGYWVRQKTQKGYRYSIHSEKELSQLKEDVIACLDVNRSDGKIFNQGGDHVFASAKMSDSKLEYIFVIETGTVHNRYSISELTDLFDKSSLEECDWSEIVKI